ncbi:MAG: M48 family metallopeptidase, partial [Pseudomonadales bacterium]
KISYRRTTSKWGHCTSEGNIQYNPLLMLAPQFVVDYIIAHEVCHLRHANHSKQFWNLVDGVYPQRNHAENWLKQHGHRLAIA